MPILDADIVERGFPPLFDAAKGLPESMQPPVFIVGCPRSGTTLVHCWLFSAGGFAVYRSESHAYTLIAPRFGDLATPADRQSFLDVWLRGEWSRRTGLSASELREIVLKSASTAEFLSAMMGEICARQGAVRWADSTPEHGLAVEAIRRGFPGAKVIHVVRDGRDVAASMVRQGWIRPWPWESDRLSDAAALYWSWVVSETRRQGRLLGENYMELRFDEIVGDRTGAMERVSRFIDAPLDEERIDRVAIGSVGKPNSSFKGSSNPLGRWASAYEPEELARMERLIGAELRDFGFELQDPERRPGVVDGLRRKSYRARFALRHGLKGVPALGRRFVSPGLLLETADGPDPDKTLRPAENLDVIRTIVAPELPPGFDRQALFETEA